MHCTTVRRARWRCGATTWDIDGACWLCIVPRPVMIMRVLEDSTHGSGRKHLVRKTSTSKMRCRKPFSVKRFLPKREQLHDCAVVSAERHAHVLPGKSQAWKVLPLVSPLRLSATTTDGPFQYHVRFLLGDTQGLQRTCMSCRGGTAVSCRH